ncbi:hypothetical protein GQ457_17G004070 [Hibiscus cannabinus]
MGCVVFFLSPCCSPSAFNSTIITLVLKVANPMKAVDFRSISCCCTVYKCITKLLANRLKQWLPSIILPNQSNFLAGRDLVENVLLVQEIVNGYGRKYKSARCALKIDLRKAFDSLNWEFIFQVLRISGSKFCE